MKLLIVDDEELTRIGVIASINWSALGIDAVYQADDGVHGLEMARLHHPEIILCDVRMPRMDGIAMLEEIESFAPDTVSIFMSGYSDKEYLKAAIRLKAVNYIEKPLEPAEIRNAIISAQKTYQHNVQSRRGARAQSQELMSKLAEALTQPYKAEGNGSDIRRLYLELSFSSDIEPYIIAYIVKPDTSLELSRSVRDELYTSLCEFLSFYQLKCLHIEKRNRYMIYFLLGEEKPSDMAINAIGDYLCRQFTPYGQYLITAGDLEKGMDKAFNSYESAVILLQNSYFFPEDLFLTSTLLKHHTKCKKQLPENAEGVLNKLISDRDRSGVEEFLSELYDLCKNNSQLLPNHVKNIYYRLIMLVEGEEKQLHDEAPASVPVTMDTLENSMFFTQPHRILTEKIENYFSRASKAKQDSPVITQIKEYISANYSNEKLSVKDIGSNVYLSASYVCTVFKNETGQTLNQYLTEYRMERAKELLEDPRYRISEISSMVGYSDGNYFGKSFKKYSGKSPSEYRDHS